MEQLAAAHGSVAPLIESGGGGPHGAGSAGERIARAGERAIAALLPRGSTPARPARLACIDDLAELAAADQVRLAGAACSNSCS
jgi:hypothetical protein